ncbi:vacuolar protein sorting-associated protein 22 homolog 1 [Prunus yedoensis var. nudiflora]|uniref:Vacuolar protein sorting-associated protein 22 homolog 1 n=1 Tax=Prunus yedoensis var. nudiflora TaxID=2094558 RepID=A0A314UTC7_PRUYE|nr:vacuolar protein sorting-associated protein 22 homolog 1 [Prunus yedoensis var. nudiflora]
MELIGTLQYASSEKGLRQVIGPQPRKNTNKSSDPMLSVEEAQGFVIVDEVERRLSWTTGRAIDAFDTLLDSIIYTYYDCWGSRNPCFSREGLAMIDDGHKDGTRRYWFPCVSSISTPGGNRHKVLFLIKRAKLTRPTSNLINTQKLF